MESYKDLDDRKISIESLNEEIQNIIDFDLNEKNENIVFNIKSIVDSWKGQQFDNLYETLGMLENNLYNTKIEYIPKTITIVIDILFLIINFYFEQDISKCFIPEGYLKCLFERSIEMLNNISNYNEIIPKFPVCIFNLVCSHFVELHNITNQPNDPIFETSSIFILNIILNLTSNSDACQEIKKRITFQHILEFYFNPNIENSLKETCLKIFYNILSNSNVDSIGFPVDQIFKFVQDVINFLLIEKHVEIIIKIVFLLVQNNLFAFKIMDDKKCQEFISKCLDYNFLLGIYAIDQKVFEIQIIALNVISTILNVDDYNFSFDLPRVISLADSNQNMKLILTALKTLFNFADSPENVFLLVSNNVLPIILLRIETGILKMKAKATKVLANMFFFADNRSVEPLMRSEAIPRLVDMISQLNNPNVLAIALKGMLNIFKRMNSMYDEELMNEVFSKSGLDEAFLVLRDEVKDKDSADDLKALMSFWTNFFKK